MQNLSLTDFVDLSDSPSLELLNNDRVADLTGLPKKGVLKSTGLSKRYILKDGKNALDLANEVTDTFLQKTGIRANNIGGIALVHTSYNKEKKIEQEIAQAIADRIGVHRELVTAISFGCAGFPKVLSEAAKLMEHIGDDKNCLILITETPSEMIDARDQACTPIFADGAIATTMKRGEGHRVLFVETEDIPATGIPDGENIFEIVEKDVYTFNRTVERRVVFIINKNISARRMIKQAHLIQEC